MPAAARDLAGRLRCGGVDEVLVNLHRVPEAVTVDLAERSGPPAVQTTFEPELLDCAGTLRQNRAWVEDEAMFLACYADNLTDFDPGQLVDAHRALGGPATLTLFQAANPSSVGHRWTGRRSRMGAFTEKPEQPVGNLVNGGRTHFHPPSSMRCKNDHP
jgi:mannose-1-phosphate guanylyltransferase